MPLRTSAAIAALGTASTQQGAAQDERVERGSDVHERVYSFVESADGARPAARARAAPAAADSGRERDVESGRAAPGRGRTPSRARRAAAPCPGRPGPPRRPASRTVGAAASQASEAADHAGQRDPAPGRGCRGRARRARARPAPGPTGTASSSASSASAACSSASSARAACLGRRAGGTRAHVRGDRRGLVRRQRAGQPQVQGQLVRAGHRLSLLVFRGRGAAARERARGSRRRC